MEEKDLNYIVYHHMKHLYLVLQKTTEKHQRFLNVFEASAGWQQNSISERGWDI